MLHIYTHINAMLIPYLIILLKIKKYKVLKK